MDKFLDTELFSYGSLHIDVGSVIVTISAILIARLLVYMIRNVLNRFFQRKDIEQGRRVALVQIAKYLIYFLTLLVILKALGIGLTGLMVGSGALLVGIGFGLQQTFNDFISGIILLFEGGVSVGDNLVVDELACTVHRIGMRTTEVVTRDGIKIIIPNSILVSNKVTNWSHNKSPARFNVDVGVSYDSDIDEVERILLECAYEQHSVRKTPAPSVQLIGYGDSSVNFRLFFYSREYILIEAVRSDIRKRVFKKLKENGIVIPFPQRDLWFKNQMDVKSEEEEL